MGSSDPSVQPPLRRNAYFSGREEILEIVAAAFQQTVPEYTCNLQVLSGLGGIGKTQLAIEYWYRNREAYSYVFWIDASDDVSLAASFSRISRALDAADHSAERSAHVERVHAWLEANHGWLMIIDNADNVGLVGQYLPPSCNGHVLMTSRATEFDSVGVTHPLCIGALPPAEAVNFILKRTGRDPSTADTQATATLIAGELGGLPLALEQAGAYILSRGIPLEGYLRAYRSRRLELLKQSTPVIGGYSETVATTWSLNFEAVRNESAAAADLLILSSFLGSAPIPFELITKGASHLGSRIEEALKGFQDTLDESLIDDLLYPLTRFSLITKLRELRLFSIHKLVQEVVRSSVEGDIAVLTRQQLSRSLDAAFPIVRFPVWLLCERVYPHAIAFLSQLPEAEMQTVEVGNLLHRCGHYADETGDYKLALSIYAKAVEVRTFLADNDSALKADLGCSINNIGVVLVKLAKYKSARAQFLYALQVRREAVGDDHLDVAQTLNNLGLVAARQDQLSEAESFYSEAMAIFDRVAEECEVERAFTLGNIAVIAHTRQDVGRAEKLYRQVLEIRRKRLGSEAPEVAVSLCDLAVVCGDQRRFDDCIAFVREALQIQRRAFGACHPAIAHSLNILGNVLSNLESLEESDKAYAEAEWIYRNTVGERHPSYAVLLINRAHNRLRAGERDESESDLVKAMWILEGSDGGEGLDVATAANNLAFQYLSNKQYKESRPWYLKACLIRERLLGTRHLSVAACLGNLGIVEFFSGDKQVAADYFARAWDVYADLEFPAVEDCGLFLWHYEQFLRCIGAQRKRRQVETKRRDVERRCGPRLTPDRR